MRSLSFRTILIAAAVGFFALGIVSTVLGPRKRNAGSVTPAPSTPAATSHPLDSNPQVTLLILGVDTLDRDAGELEAVWVASLRPTAKELYLFGYATDRPLPDGRSLRQAYAESRRDPSALAPVTALPVDATIVLDAEGFADVIDFLGGVPADGKPVEGQAALNVLSLLRDDPEASLLGQARLLEALSARGDRVQPGVDLQPLLGLVPDHASVDSPAEKVLTSIAPYLPLSADRVHVYLPLSGAPSPAE